MVRENTVLHAPVFSGQQLIRPEYTTANVNPTLCCPQSASSPSYLVTPAPLARRDRVRTAVAWRGAALGAAGSIDQEVPLPLAEVGLDHLVVARQHVVDRVEHASQRTGVVYVVG